MGTSERKMDKSRRSMRSQASSAAVTARDRYSASVDDQATVCCFFALQLIGFVPKKMQKTEMDLRSSGSPAQSVSEKAGKESEPG